MNLEEKARKTSEALRYKAKKLTDYIDNYNYYNKRLEKDNTQCFLKEYTEYYKKLIEENYIKFRDEVEEIDKRQDAGNEWYKE